MSIITIENVMDFEFTFEGLDKAFESDLVLHEQKMTTIHNQKMEEYERKMKEYEKIKAIYKNLPFPKKEKEEKAENELVNVSKYISERIFSTNNEGYYIISDGCLKFLNGQGWAKYQEKIKCKSKNLLKLIVDCPNLYKLDVYEEDFIVDSQTYRINLKPQIPFTYNPSLLGDKLNGDYIIKAMKEILTSDDPKDWAVVEYIIACMIQGKKSGLILVLCGLGGVGKSFMVDNIIHGMLGKALAKPTEGTLSGEDKFNECLIGARCAVLEETSGTCASQYLAIMKYLKETSTSPRITIRRMHLAGFEVNNTINWVVNTNHPRDLNPKDRRSEVPTVSNKYLNDVNFFAELKTKITNESLRYVFNHFYSVDTSKQMLANESETKIEFKEEGMETAVRFLIEEYIILKPLNPRHHKMSIAFEDYKAWCLNNKKKASTQHHFSYTTRQYVPKALNQDGKEKQEQHTPVYNFSCDVLAQRLINDMKVLTPQQFEQWKHDVADKNDNTVDSDGLVEHCDMINKYEKILKDKDSEISQLKQELLEMQEKLKEFEEAKKAKEEKKKNKEEKKKDKKVKEESDEEEKEVEKVGDKFKEKKKKPFKVYKSKVIDEDVMDGVLLD